MISISGIGPRLISQTRTKRAGSAFSVEEAPVSGELSAPCTNRVTGLLGLQETTTATASAAVGPANPETATREYAETLLTMLDQVQLSLLRGRSEEPAPSQPSPLLSGGPHATDQGLGAVVLAIQVRLAVEAARASKE